MTRDETAQGRVRIPADVDRPDRILAGLTARQLAILAVTGLLAYVGYAATRGLVPPLVFAVLAAPVLVAGVALALGRYGGIGLDRLAAAALRHARTPHRQVPADGGDIPPAPAWDGWPTVEPPAPLQLPAAGLDDAGVLDLGAQGTAVVCRCTSVNFALRTPGEQQALIAAYGRFLNAASAGIQLVVRAERVDLTDPIAALTEAAGGLPHPALEAAAREHAAFLAELAERRDLLRRQLLLVLHQPAPAGRRPDPAASTGRLLRRAEEAATALATAGVTVDVLDGPAAAAVLAAATDPNLARRPAGLAAPDAVITGPTQQADQEGDQPWLFG